MDVTREEYDPGENPEHRVTPVVEPERTPIGMPPELRPIRMDELTVEAGERVSDPVEGRMADRPHFIRNVDGVELCGQDGQPWPCDEVQRLEAEIAAANPQPHELVILEEAARAAGLTPEELRARLEAQDRRYR